jgi:hypothetical protein
MNVVHMSSMLSLAAVIGCWSGLSVRGQLPEPSPPDCSNAAIPDQPADDDCSAIISGEIVTGVDDVPGTTIRVEPTLLESLGSNDVTITVSNELDQTSCIVTVNVSVVDETAPEVDVPFLDAVTGECSVALMNPPTATDNCVGTITGTTAQTTFDSQGTFEVTWTYDDGNGNTTTQVQDVVVDDISPPVPDVATLAETGECSVTIDTVPTASDNCVGLVEGTTTDPLTFTNQGTFEVTWIYDDGNGNTSTQVQDVVVADTTAPVVDLEACPEELWPPNHKMVDVKIKVTTSDNCGGPVDCWIEEIIDSEEMEKRGNGNTSQDVVFSGEMNDLTVQLRAERSGRSKEGRTYTICVVCQDQAANETHASVDVIVPHDQRNGQGPGGDDCDDEDDGPYDDDDGEEDGDDDLDDDGDDYGNDPPDHGNGGGGNPSPGNGGGNPFADILNQLVAVLMQILEWLRSFFGGGR